MTTITSSDTGIKCGSCTERYSTAAVKDDGEVTCFNCLGSKLDLFADASLMDLWHRYLSWQSRHKRDPFWNPNGQATDVMASKAVQEEYWDLENELRRKYGPAQLLALRRTNDAR